MRRTHLCLIALWCIPFLVKGQHILEKSNNIFRASDVIVKQRVEYKDPGRSGANVLWNFSKLKTLDEAYTLAYSQVGDSIVGTEHRTMYYHTLQGDSLFLNGYENMTTWMKNVRPELLLKYPFHYGDSLSSYYHGLGKYSNELLLYAMGKSIVKADAYGMMIIPGGDTLKNVLRIHTCKLLTNKTDDLYKWDINQLFRLPPVNNDSIECRLNDRAIWRVETLRWYAKGYRYPIFETTRSVIIKNGYAKELFKMSFFYPLQEHYYLDEDSLNLAILENKNNEMQQGHSHGENDDIYKDDILNYNLYQNFNTNNIALELHLNQDAEIVIYLYDIQGHTLLVSPKKKYSSGYYVETIELPEFGINQFVLRISVNEKKYTEKIIKQ